MILVTRHLLVSRVESEVNNVFKLSLAIGSDSISELCGLRSQKSTKFEPIQLS